MNKKPDVWHLKNCKRTDAGMEVEMESEEFDKKITTGKRSWLIPVMDGQPFLWIPTPMGYAIIITRKGGKVGTDYLQKKRFFK